MVKINWTPTALRDLEEIGEYVSHDSIKYANLIVDKLFRSVEILDMHPLSGRVVPEFHNDSIRELIYGNYRLVYRIVTELRIDIITVHHSKRLLSNNPALQEKH